MSNYAVLPLRIFLLALFGVLLVFQTLSFPGQFAYMAQQSPQDAWLRWPLTAIAVFVILCAEVVLISTWRLLGLVQDGRIFSDVAFGWVDAIVWAIGAAWVVLAGLLGLIAYNAEEPPVRLMMFFFLVAFGVVALLMVVMRALLHQAAELRADMEAVI